MPGSNAARRTILVTGFGGFPGAAHNPTERIVRQLGRHRARLARLGIDLHCTTLPVDYAGLQARLDTLASTVRPDVVLHLGLAGRRRRISVETRAVNRAHPLRPDATGSCPPQVLMPGRAPALRATYPAARILAALRRADISAGAAAEASRDAGDYLCNAALYRSLAMATAAEVGFIHVPRPRRAMPLPRGAARPSPDALAAAALVAVLAMVPRPPARGRHAG